MNSKCLGNALVHCDGLITVTTNDSSTVPSASALAPAGPAAIEKDDKDDDFLQSKLGPAGPAHSKCLGNALVHDGLMTSTATNDSPPRPTQP